MSCYSTTKGVALLLTVLCLLSCAKPYEVMDKSAVSQGYEKKIITGTDFDHVVYFAAKDARRLHVYLEGDGRPWASRYVEADDPTGRRALALDLMNQDSEQRLYLARPCYNGLNQQANCEPSLWTDARYSPRVVESMAAALQKIIEQQGVQELVLIGHSGGGVLAMLLAERLPQTHAVVTLAANLDVDAWARLHGYSALTTSLNPAQRPALAENIWQLHLAGEKDENVPPVLIHRAVDQQARVNFISIDGFDHRCCWSRLWPQVLQALNDKDVSVLQKSETTNNSCAIE